MITTFKGRMWCAMFRGTLLPGYFVFRTRKAAWDRIMSRVHDKTKQEAMKRGWRVVRVDATLRLVDPLPSKRQIETWERQDRLAAERIEQC